MNKTTLKIVGWVASGVGLIANLVSSFIEDKKTEQEIQERVNDAVAKIIIEKVEDGTTIVKF